MFVSGMRPLLAFDAATGPLDSPSQEALGKVHAVQFGTSKPQRRCHLAEGGIGCYDPSASPALES